MKRLIGLLFAVLTLPAAGQTATPSPFAAHVQDVMTRAANGHSPAVEDAALPTKDPVDPTALKEVVSPLMKALGSEDGQVRAFALTTLLNLQPAPPAPETETPPTEAASSTPPPGSAGSAAATPFPAVTTSQLVPAAALAVGGYSAEMARVLAPAVPAVAARLIDELPANRVLAVNVLGGFTREAPATIYPPLISFLKRDDAAGSTGLLVAGVLVQLGPLSEDTASALARYLRRADQTTDSRSTLIDTIATARNQNPLLNKALLSYLNADDAGVRARLILSLPLLDLSPDVFTDTKARIGLMATSGQESLQVTNAAKAVAPCWTATRMAAGCPVY